MRGIAMIALLLYSASATAGTPADVVISDMRVYQGARLDTAPTDQYATLIDQLGADVVANPAAIPAATTGVAGWDFSLQNTFGFVPAYKDDNGPTGWQLANPDGTPPNFTATPNLVLRKGLPFGLEVGGRGGWMSGSRQGVVGGFLRVAPLEGSQPLPDLSFQAGYAAYVGNPELSVGVTDLSATLGTRLKLFRTARVTFSHWEPWFTFSMLRITAAPRLDAATLADVGAYAIGGKDATEPARWLPRWGVGFQVTTNRVLLRLASDWAPKAAPTLTIGLGYAL